jgi:hypothetical protein
LALGPLVGQVRPLLYPGLGGACRSTRGVVPARAVSPDAGELPGYLVQGRRVERLGPSVYMPHGWLSWDAWWGVV